MFSLFQSHLWDNAVTSMTVLTIENILLTQDKKTATWGQGGITYGAIDEASRSSKALDERVIQEFFIQIAVIAHFHDKNDVFD